MPPGQAEGKIRRGVRPSLAVTRDRQAEIEMRSSYSICVIQIGVEAGPELAGARGAHTPPERMNRRREP